MNLLFRTAKTYFSCQNSCKSYIIEVIRPKRGETNGPDHEESCRSELSDGGFCCPVPRDFALLLQAA